MDMMVSQNRFLFRIPDAWEEIMHYFDLSSWSTTQYTGKLIIYQITAKKQLISSEEEAAHTCRMLTQRRGTGRLPVPAARPSGGEQRRGTRNRCRIPAGESRSSTLHRAMMDWRLDRRSSRQADPCGGMMQPVDGMDGGERSCWPSSPLAEMHRRLHWAVGGGCATGIWGVSPGGKTWLKQGAWTGGGRACNFDMCWVKLNIGATYTVWSTQFDGPD
jgi:hypothetical protein